MRKLLSIRNAVPIWELGFAKEHFAKTFPYYRIGVQIKNNMFRIRTNLFAAHVPRGDAVVPVEAVAASCRQQSADPPFALERDVSVAPRGGALAAGAPRLALATRPFHPTNIRSKWRKLAESALSGTTVLPFIWPPGTNV